MNMKRTPSLPIDICDLALYNSSVQEALVSNPQALGRLVLLSLADGFGRRDRFERGRLDTVILDPASSGK